VLEQLTSTVVVVGAAVFVVRSLFVHVLARDLDRYKIELQAASNEKLEAIRFEATKPLEEHRSELAVRASKHQRLADEILPWSVPVLDAIDELQRRLENILDGSLFVSLDRSADGAAPGWSITSDDVMESTLYAFAKYFCWMDLLSERLTFGFFDSLEAREELFRQCGPHADP
jgi:hypothetical protein